MVIDASALVAALIDRTAIGQRLRERLIAEPSIHAPHLLDVETANALRNLERSGKVSRELAATAVAQLGELPINRYPHAAFLDRIWSLRNQLTAYDAAYVALAEAAGTTLVTLDGRLKRANGLRCEVELISD